MFIHRPAHYENRPDPFRYLDLGGQACIIDRRNGRAALWFGFFWLRGGVSLDRAYRKGEMLDRHAFSQRFPRAVNHLASAVEEAS